jgi:hypothetical protein
MDNFAGLEASVNETSICFVDTEAGSLGSEGVARSILRAPCTSNYC